jgi:hypothetical protein
VLRWPRALPEDALAFVEWVRQNQQVEAGLPLPSASVGAPQAGQASAPGRKGRRSVRHLRPPASRWEAQSPAPLKRDLATACRSRR